MIFAAEPVAAVSAVKASTPVETEKQQQLRAASRELEASFVAEMLKSAGMGKTRGSFGGGEGEDAFASFLVTAQAKMIVKAGGFGLAESIYQSLLKEQNSDR